MKLGLVLVFGAALVYGADEAKQKDKRTTAPAGNKKAAVTTTNEVKVPEGAVKVDDYTWKYTDAKGAKWFYRQTLFGIAKYPESAVAEKSEADRAREAESITAVADGDAIRFEKPGLFGVQRWLKKVTDLDETEKAAWERSKAAKKKLE